MSIIQQGCQGCGESRCTVREQETDFVYDHPEKGGSMLLDMSCVNLLSCKV